MLRYATVYLHIPQLTEACQAPRLDANVSIPYIPEQVILHTKVAECILQFIDQIYQVLIHFNALERDNNRKRRLTQSKASTRWKGTPFGNSVVQFVLVVFKWRRIGSYNGCQSRLLSTFLLKSPFFAITIKADAFVFKLLDLRLFKVN